MSKIKRIEMLFVIFLLSIMLFSCEYSVPPGKPENMFCRKFIYEINENSLFDNKVSIGFGIIDVEDVREKYIQEGIKYIYLEYITISVFVDNEETPVEFMRFEHDEVLSDKYNVISDPLSATEIYNNIIEFDLLKYDIKEYVKLVITEDRSWDCALISTHELFIEATEIDNDLYVYNYQYTRNDEVFEDK